MALFQKLDKNEEEFIKCCKSIRRPKRLGPISFDDKTETIINKGFAKEKIKIKQYKIDKDLYNKYVSDAAYKEKYPEYYSDNFHEKSLEHFIAADLLDFRAGEVFIDIASQHSPVPEIYARLFHVRSYRQDLDYPQGLCGDCIGGDAANMDVPDGFAQKMTLHCSLEHFEEDSDALFTKEAARVLSSGGQLCIVPLYIYSQYVTMTDPFIFAKQQVPFDPEAIVYCHKGWNNRHGRFYSPKKLVERILGASDVFDFSIYRISNASDIDKSCYARYALLLKKRK